MDKLIVNDRGEAQITNDGATILKLLEIVHPAARTLVDIARAQDAEVGDGTTSVVLLATQMLKEVRGYIEEGVSPHIIMKGFRKATQLVGLYPSLLCVLSYPIVRLSTALKRYKSPLIDQIPSTHFQPLIVALLMFLQKVPIATTQMRIHIDVLKTHSLRKAVLLQNGRRRCAEA